MPNDKKKDYLIDFEASDVGDFVRGLFGFKPLDSGNKALNRLDMLKITADDIPDLPQSSNGQKIGNALQPPPNTNVKSLTQKPDGSTAITFYDDRELKPLTPKPLQPPQDLNPEQPLKGVDVLNFAQAEQQDAANRGIINQLLNFLSTPNGALLLARAGGALSGATPDSAAGQFGSLIQGQLAAPIQQQLTDATVRGETLPETQLLGLTPQERENAINRGEAIRSRKVEEGQRERQLGQVDERLKQAARGFGLDVAKFEASLYQFDVGVGLTLKELDQKRQFARQKLAGEAGDLRLKLRGEIRQEPAFKDLVQVRNGYENTQVGFNQANAQGDLAIVNGIAKMLDPQGVVRPSEFDTVESAQGFFEKTLNIKQKLFEGDRLRPSARKRFKVLAEALFDQKQRTLNGEIEAVYGSIAAEKGFSLESVYPSINSRPGLAEGADVGGISQEQIRSYLEEQGL